MFGAGYRDDPAQLTAAAPAAPALLTSPMAGETLSGGTARFTWSTGSQADRYYVAISAVDGCDLFGGDIGTALFATVASLPTNGSTVAVRLYSLLNGAWQAQDYNFTTGP